jgi:hypothetical protein
MGVGPLYKTLADVNLSGLADGDVATYVAATQKWVPITRAALATALGVNNSLPFAALMSGIVAPDATNAIDFSTVLENSGYTVAGANTTLQCPTAGIYFAQYFMQVDGVDLVADLQAAPLVRVEGFVGTPPVLIRQYDSEPVYAARATGLTANCRVPQRVLPFVFEVVTPATDLFQLEVTNDINTPGSGVSIDAVGVIVVTRVQ